MIRQSELFDHAADCEQHMKVVGSAKQATFRLLRDLWIALASESATMPTDRLVREIAALKKMQAAAEWQFARVKGHHAPDSDVEATPSTTGSR